jgi:hypothetical protein
MRVGTDGRRARANRDDVGIICIKEFMIDDCFG